MQILLIYLVVLKSIVLSFDIKIILVLKCV